MSNLTDDEAKRYDKMAADHADFLCYKIFKPAFMMAFIHGAEHMKEDMMSGACDAKKPKILRPLTSEELRQMNERTVEVNPR